MKCIAYFSVKEPLIICEQFIDKKKTMVTSGNFFIRYCYAQVYSKLNLHITGPDRKKTNKLAVNTKVGQLFLLGLFLKHYFVDSNIRNL